MKKVLSLLVVLSMLLSILPATVSAVHWADADVAYLVENGAIAEDDTMLENLDTPITRSQMVKVIVSLLEGDDPIEGKEYFTDITAEDTHIAKAAENGYVNGFGDGTFRPDNPITRQDFFTIVGRAYKLEGTATNEFTDADSTADYAKPYVDALQSIGIVNGYGDGTVNPRGNITIAETLAVMRRTDEHVKANTPKEEEKPKPKSSSNSNGNSYVPAKPKPKPVINGDFVVEYTDDCASGVVAYITSNIDVINAPARIGLIRGSKDTYYRANGGYTGPGLSTYEVASRFNAIISMQEGKYAVPEYGPYKLIIEDTNGTTIDAYEIMVTPPESEDTTPPTLTIELPEDLTMPLEVKVNASDDVELARLDYAKVKFSKTTYIEKGYKYKVNPNSRTDITDGSFTINDSYTYVVCAMDTSGNCAYAEIAVSSSKPTNVIYVSESISEYLEESPDESGYDTAPPKGGEGTPSATLTVELEDNFSGDYVATIKPEYSLNPGTSIAKSYLVAGSGWQWPAGGMKNIESQLEIYKHSGAVIEETDGVFRIPTFGDYQCYVLDSNGDYGMSEMITVNPPESEDVTPPQLHCFFFDENKGFPRTVMVRASDDTAIAKINYVNANKLRGFTGEQAEFYKAMAAQHKKVEGNSFTVTEKGYYIVCAMDEFGNCSYFGIQLNASGNDPNSSYGGFQVLDDLTSPTILYTLSTEEECDGTVEITTDIYDNTSVVACGWFFMREYNEMPGGVEQVARGCKTFIQTFITFDDLDEEVETNDFRCGGVGSICVLSNYYMGKKTINRFMGNITITAKENGVYFIYAKDKNDNITVRRIDIDNIKAPTATYTTEYGDFENGSCARVAVSTDVNKDAPIKTMLLVKDSAIPSVEIGGDKYYACTDNFKIQKEIAAIEEGGDYITEQDGYFQVPSYGEYTLYIIDEFGNCSTTPINVAQP